MKKAKSFETNGSLMGPQKDFIPTGVGSNVVLIIYKYWNDIFSKSSNVL